MTMYVHVMRTRYPHWGLHSGINQYLKHVDNTNYCVFEKLVPDSDEEFPIRNKFFRRMLREMVQARGMQWYKLSDLFAEICALKSCLLRRVDVVHYLDAEHSAQYLPPLMKRLYRIRPKFVATYHQPPDLLEKLIRKDIVSMFDCVTVVSSAQVAYFGEFLERDKIKLILHGIDTEFFRPGEESEKKDKFICITVGRYFRDFKALREVAVRLSLCREIEFHVITSLPTECEDMPNVTVFRDIDDAFLVRLYQQSDLLFLPLIQSTANNALLEGIACGLPVVSTDLPAVREYLPGQEAVLVKENDSKLLAETIHHLYSNPALRREMGLMARHRAKELDWRSISSKYEAVYRKVAHTI